MKRLILVLVCLLLFAGCAGPTVYTSAELQLEIPSNWQVSPVEADLDQYFFYSPDGGMIYLTYQTNPSEDYLAQPGMLEIFIQAFTWGIPDAQVLDISQEEMAGYNWAKVSYTGEQYGVTWYNELYIAYTPSHIYCVCCAAPQDDFDGLRPTFSQVLDTIQVTPVS